MENATTPPGTVALIAAMVTPALLILGATSLVASALIRMGRVVDRARTLAAAVHAGEVARLGLDEARLRSWLERHAARARQAERSIGLLYAAVVIFIATCLSIGLDRAGAGCPVWLPGALAISGTLPLLAGGGLMVAESRLSARQIDEEITGALARLKETHP
jgi:uncharacterized protein DUF2721